MYPPTFSERELEALDALLGIDRAEALHRTLAAAPDLLRDLAEIVHLLDTDAEAINTKYAHETIRKATDA